METVIGTAIGTVIVITTEAVEVEAEATAWGT
jgi:hypothetical protein